MTSLNSKATSSDIKKMKIDELERIIAALRATGQDEEAKDFEELKPAIEDLIEDLFSLVDNKSESTMKKLFDEHYSKLNKPQE